LDAAGIMKFLTISSALLASVIALGGQQPAMAQQPHFDFEVTVDDIGRTIFRCSSAEGLQIETVDCSGNVMQAECDGEAIVVDINDSGTCLIKEGTELDHATLDRALQGNHSLMVTGPYPNRLRHGSGKKLARWSSSGLLRKDFRNRVE
jgi:hypothetical protein